MAWIAAMVGCRGSPSPKLPPVGRIELSFGGSAVEAMAVVGRLSDRPMVPGDRLALEGVQVTLTGTLRLRPALWSTVLETAFREAGLEVSGGDPIRVDPGPREVVNIGLVGLTLPVVFVANGRLYIAWAAAGSSVWLSPIE